MSNSGGKMNDEHRVAIERKVLGWPGVTMEYHPGGSPQEGFTVPPAATYRLGRRELGHVHVTGVACLPVPRLVHAEGSSAGRAEPHAAGFVGVVSHALECSDDVLSVIALFRFNDERARHAATTRRRNHHDARPESNQGARRP